MRPLNPEYLTKKQSVFQKIVEFVEKLKGAGGRTFSEHLKNIFASQERTAEAVIRKFRITANDGKNHQTQFYNLDAVISVGYRDNSLRTTQFRQWATGVLREFSIKGYVLDRQRMMAKEMPVPITDRFAGSGGLGDEHDAKFLMCEG